MTVRRFGLALFSALFFFCSTSPAYAIHEVNFGVGAEYIFQNMSNGTIIKVKSDEGGRVRVNLAPGTYQITIDGKTLAAAIDRIHPPAPPKRSGGGLSLSIGGFGGGSSRSSSSGHEGAGPIGGRPSNDGQHSSGGGMGFGLGIPVGGGNQGHDHPEVDGFITITIQPASTNPNDLSVNNIKFETPYCRDAKGDIRIGFTVPRSGGSASAVPNQEGDKMYTVGLSLTF
jgi:hypothetical protein